MEELITTKRDGVLSFTDGTSAYGVPLGYALYDKDTLYFGMNPSGRKCDYLRKSNRVCFTMYTTFFSPRDSMGNGWWSIILDGELSQITRPEEIKYLADTLVQKGLLPAGLKDTILSAILQDPQQSNFFKMKITGWGGKEMPLPQDEGDR